MSYRTIIASLLAVSAGLSFVLGGPTPARADGTDQEVLELKKANEAIRYRFKTVDPAPSAIDTGGAAILVNAPLNVAREVVTDFRHYAKFIQPFEQARVLSRKNGVSEVYLQVPVAHGAMTIWAVVLIGPPEKDGEGEKIVANFEKGNVSAFHAVWKLRPVDAQTTVVKLEVFVDPNLPFSASLVSGELDYAADKGVSGVRARAEALVKPDVAKN